MTQIYINDNLYFIKNLFEMLLKGKLNIIHSQTNYNLNQKAMQIFPDFTQFQNILHNVKRFF